MNRHLDERSAPQVDITAGFSRVQAALGRRRIPLQDRHDLAQDIVLAVLEGSQKRGVEIADPERWLNGVILNQVRGWHQRKFVERKRLDAEMTVDRIVDDEAPDVEELLISKGRRRLVDELYEELSVDHLEALVAHAIDGLTFKQIATRVEKPVSTVYGSYRAGKRALRAALARWKARQRGRGVLLLPLTIGALFDPDRTTPEPPGEAETVGNVGSEGDAPASERRQRHLPRSIGWKAAAPLLGAVFACLIGADVGFSAAAPLGRNEVPAPAAMTAKVATAPSTPDPGGPALAVAVTGAPHAPAAPAARTEVRQERAAVTNELAMFDRARAAFILGNMPAALQALGELTRKYPWGMYARERDRLWLAVLVNLGRTADACQRAERFRRAYPKSPLPDEMDDLCLVRQ